MTGSDPHPSRGSRLGRLGGLLLGLLVAVAVLAPWLAPFDPSARVGIPFSPPGGAHLLGTNDVGQDILSELLLGARVSLGIGLVAAAMAVLVGAAVGLATGYLGGWVDAIGMRVVDVTLALPFLPLVIVVGVFLGGGMITQVLVIAAVAWAGPARELRAHVLTVRHRADVEAAWLMGARRRHLLSWHLLPAVAPLLAPQLVRAGVVAVLTEASLSFLGLGDPATRSWGTMLHYAQARGAMLTDAWRWWVLPPSLGIAATVVGLAFVGYALEEKGRPGLRGGRRRPGTGLAPARRRSPGTGPALEVSDLSIGYSSDDAPAVVRGLSLTVARGEVVGLVGASGCGKSTLAAAIVGLLPPAARVTAGSVVVDGHDLAGLAGRDWSRLRGRSVALVPQDSMGSLNPVQRVGDQIGEALAIHAPGARVERRRRTLALLEAVGLTGRLARAFPHELSGGMRQRVVVAMALAHDPVLVVADEPTTGLDPVTRRDLADLLARLTSERGMALLLISHDLGVVSRLANRVVVLDRGAVAEAGPTAEVLNAPGHPAARRLVAAMRCGPGRPTRDSEAAGRPGGPVLEVTGASVGFGTGSRRITAVDGVSLVIRTGEAVGLVGASGAGKSTLARLVCGLTPPDHGVVALAGEPPTRARGRIQLVSQDPYEALSPARTVIDIVAEPLIIAGLRRPDLVARARAALGEVHLDPDRFGGRHPHELSGGERQRVALARALVARPVLVVADEPTAMLDVTLAVELMDLLAEVRDRHRLSLLLITHELSHAARLCDRLVVMGGGRVVDEGPTARVLAAPAAGPAAALVAAGTEVITGAML